ncbi:uncharacterized protein C10orf120 homolog [Meriones unguiculatus]|uniref:uncharacterized protein C10orf120 homolog n=1 Tax=Meriones unguiculatus TaxID=10047 RepID=UPI000B4F58F2|nr:uncharacterized protein C10orf120 homolog [Meriones unguiculatus]
MIKRWETRFQKCRSQRAEHPKAQEGTAVEGEQNNKELSKIPSVQYPLIAQDLPHHKKDIYPALPLGIWTSFYKSDPCIALGKHSPMEQEILNCGGVHTIAARRFLADKVNKEWKMLRKLRERSPDYKVAMQYKRQPLSPALSGPPEKVWTATVSVPTEEFEMPHREMLSINKHLKRMKLAHDLRNKQFSTYIQRLRIATLLSGAELSSTGTDKSGENSDVESSNKASHGEKGEAGSKHTNPHEIVMNVTFKSEEPKKCVVGRWNDQKTFLPRKRQERCTTGLTNRNLFPIAGFPGDLMLMNQDFKARGLHPSDAIKMYWLSEDEAFRAHKPCTTYCPY